MGITYGNGKSSDDVPCFSRSGIPSHDDLRVVLIGDPTQLIPMTQVRGHCRNQPFWGKDFGHIGKSSPSIWQSVSLLEDQKIDFSWEESKDPRSFVNVFLKGSCLELHDVMRIQTAHPQKVYLLLYPKNHLGAVLDFDLGRSDTNINQYSSRQYLIISSSKN